MFVTIWVELFDNILSYLSLGWCQENVLVTILCHCILNYLSAPTFTIEWNIAK